MSDFNRLCLWCLEVVAPGEEDPRCPAGAIDLTEGPRFAIYHRECLTRATVGSIDHQLGCCTCFGGAGSHGDPPGMTPRAAARAAADLLRQVNLSLFRLQLRKEAGRSWPC